MYNAITLPTSAIIFALKYFTEIGKRIALLCNPSEVGLENPDLWKFKEQKNEEWKNCNNRNNSVVGVGLLREKHSSES
jgi:hypothetical protein